MNAKLQDQGLLPVNERIGRCQATQNHEAEAATLLNFFNRKVIGGSRPTIVDEGQVLQPADPNMDALHKEASHL